MKTRFLRQVRKKYTITILKNSVVVQNNRTKGWKEFPNCGAATGYMVCEIHGFGYGCTYLKRKLSIINAHRLKLKLSDSI